MWFAALGTYRQNPWFVSFVVQLLKNSPDGNKIIRTQSFPEIAAALHPRRPLRLSLHHDRASDAQPERGGNAKTAAFIYDPLRWNDQNDSRIA